MGVKVFKLPDPGEGLTEAEIISWKVAAGDTLTVNQIVVEIETAKSLVELPIPWDGSVVSLLVGEGETVEVGTPIITVEVAGMESDPGVVGSGGASSGAVSAGGAPADGAAGAAAVAGEMAGSVETGAAVPGDSSRVVADAPGAGGGSLGGGAASGPVRTFPLPDPGEGLTEAEIVTWKVAPGDTVKVNQIVVEIETAKSLVELPIPWDGTVAELLVQQGETVPVGTPIITIAVAGEAGAAPAPGDAGTTGAAASSAGGAASGADEGEKREPNLVGYGAIAGSTKRRARKGGVAPAPGAGAGRPGQQAPAAAPQATSPAPAQAASPAQAPTTQAAVPAAQAAPAPTAERPTGPAGPVSREGRPLAKPPVRKYAKDHGVDLALVAGSGEGGIISREDVDAFLAGGSGPAGGATGAGARLGAEAATQHSGVPAAAGGASAGLAARASGERETRIPVKGVRKMTAAAMVGSAFTAPHVTEFVTIDVTETMELVERLKKDRDFRDVKVTPLLVVAKALILACKRNPGVNAVWDEAAGEIVVKHYVNLGIAAATPRGLVVPNIKDADAMTMRELASAMGELVDTARAGRTQPADMAQGTITITNVGVFGVDTGTPIINPGESAILAFGAVKRMPWVVSDAHGAESVVPRWVTQLALSFDHRLIDGDLGSRFLADVAAILSDPAKGLVWG